VLSKRPETYTPTKTISCGKSTGLIVLHWCRNTGEGTSSGLSILISLMIKFGPIREIDSSTPWSRGLRPGYSSTRGAIISSSASARLIFSRQLVEKQ
jgi:hypothetical protein